MKHVSPTHRRHTLLAISRALLPLLLLSQGCIENGPGDTANPGGPSGPTGYDPGGPSGPTGHDPGPVGICEAGSERSCGESGLLGNCARGTERCDDSSGEPSWVCEIAPAPRDGCTPGDDANCNGTPNEGCSCAPGAEQACGPCLDGVQTCSDRGGWGECEGATRLTTYFEDADGDGFGSSQVARQACAAPQGFVAAPGDCCDTDERAHSGQLAYYSEPRGCGGGFDFNCDGELTKTSTSTQAACVESRGPVITTLCPIDQGHWDTVVPECGVTGTWQLDNPPLILGGYVPEQRLQACR